MTEERLVGELKYVGNETLADYAISLLESGCLPDPEYPLGQINSIYFDTPNLTALADKLNGDNLKLKVRIRWYGNLSGATGPGEVPAFIEIKHRIGSARRKNRRRVSVPARWINEVPLGDPSLPAFLYRQAGLFDEAIPDRLLPSICISYERRRYLCPRTGSRLAVDRDIRALRINEALLPAVVGVRLDRALCEFKSHGGTPPPWGLALYRAGFRLRSFSKYGECMTQVLQGGAPHE
jgi:hypothetical protein